jgi:hypothetical protein
MSVSSRPFLDWDRHTSTILDLFVTQNKTLNEVMVHMMEQHGFEATYVNIYGGQIITLTMDTIVRGNTNSGFQISRM